MMKAVLMREPGGSDVLYIGEHEEPTMGDDDLLVRVEATALNRADLLQRRGLYPPPIGASDILGLEMAGTVVGVGANVSGWKEHDRVCALLPGGGYAEYVSIPAAMAMRLPDPLTFEQGAAIPEVFLTAFLNLFYLGDLKHSHTVLVHAGASGVGTAAIQLIREAGAVSFVTAGSEKKLEGLLELGGASGWNYRNGSFVEWVLDRTKGLGVQIILDFVGAPYFQSNLRCLAQDGRLILIGTMGGATVKELDLSDLLVRRLQVIGTALRSRSSASKVALTEAFTAFAMPRFEAGKLTPVIDTVFDWREVAAAHQHMETNANIGKIVLRVGAST